MILRHRFGGRRLRRSGFTLLEILLAALIAGLLLAALYAAMYTTLLQTQMTRDAVEAEDLSRGIFNRLSIDLTGTLAPLPPKSGGNAAASGGATTGGSAGAAAGAAPAAGATPAAPAAGAGGATSAAPAAAGAAATAPTGGSTDASQPGATDNATALSADFAFQGGVIGEETKLVIYAGRTPEAFGRYGNPGDQVRADQRQIIYWLEPGRGLYRRERPWVTADGVRNSIEADPDAPDSVLLAEEVVGLTLAYSDGTSWASTWDGTTPGPDGVTPLGPPRAIKVTLDLRIPASRGEPIAKTVSQIIAVRSAPGTYTPPLLEAPSDGASDSSGSPTTDTSGSSGSGGSGASGSNSSNSGKTGNTPSSGANSGGKTNSSGSGSPSGSPSGKTGTSGSGSMPSLPSGFSGSGGSGSTPSLPSMPSGSGSRPSGSSGGSGATPSGSSGSGGSGASPSGGTGGTGSTPSGSGGRTGGTTGGK